MSRELAPVRNSQKFDEQALGYYLTSKLSGFGNVEKMNQFKGGQSNPG